MFMLGAQKFRFGLPLYVSSGLVELVLVVALASVEMAAPTACHSDTLKDAAIEMTCGKEVGAASQLSSQQLGPLLHGVAHTPQCSMPWQASFANLKPGSPSEGTGDMGLPKLPLVIRPG